LTAADFEIYQNRLPQAVASSVYIKNQADAATQPAVFRKAAPNIQPIPGTALKREDVRRTIVFVVDNLSMKAGDLHHAKMSITRFMETQMQPEDMVAVISTSYGTGAISFFSSDKRQIAARVNGLPFAVPMEWETEDPKRVAGEEAGSSSPQSSGRVYAAERWEAAAKMANEDLKARIHGYQVSAVSYSIRALKDMPGRKILFFMSSMPVIEKYAPVPPAETSTSIINVSEERTETAEVLSYNFGSLPGDLSEMYGSIFDKLADDALRAGVVVHTLDTRGANLPDLDLERSGAVRAPHGIGRAPETNYFEGLNGLSHRTGGIFVQNSNFFLDGVGREANNMIGGYYLLSYAPPPSTFDSNRKNVYHSVDVRVKRKGAVVYTRDGFYGRTESEADSDEPAHPLQDALFSPFRHADLNVNMAAGYIRDAKAGYLIRSWIHVDPKDVKIIETEDGGALIDIETVCMTSGIDGRIHDYNHSKYALAIEPENKSEGIARILEHGIRFSMLLPVKKPGLYTVHITVQDTESGRTGSAWQPLEIPDLRNKGLALSDIFMITSADDLIWMRSDVTKNITEGVFAPVFQAEDVRSPALRSYLPGDSLQTLVMLYNAGAKAIAASDIEIQSVLYKDGAEYQRGNPIPVAGESAENHDGIQILRRFTIGSEMPPGDYVLQQIVSDKKNSKKKEGTAARTISFTIYR
jgi:VWFA-related protein